MYEKETKGPERKKRKKKNETRKKRINKQKMIGKENEQKKNNADQRQKKKQDEENQGYQREWTEKNILFTHTRRKRKEMADWFLAEGSKEDTGNIQLQRSARLPLLLPFPCCILCSSLTATSTRSWKPARSPLELFVELVDVDKESVEHIKRVCACLDSVDIRLMTAGSRIGLSKTWCLVDALQQGSVDDEEEENDDDDDEELSICCYNCLLSTLELFASINEGEELRSVMTLIFTSDWDNELSVTVVVIGSVEVFSPLVEHIADDGDERFWSRENRRDIVNFFGSVPSFFSKSGRIRRRALINQLHTWFIDKSARRDKFAFSSSLG